MIALLLLLQESVVLRTAEGPAVFLGEQALKPGEPQTVGGLVVWVTDLIREKAFARLKEMKGVHLAVCSGRGLADAEPLRVGEAWLVPAPASPSLRGRLEVAFRDGKPAAVASRMEPVTKPSDAAARLAASKGVEAPPTPALEGITRALRFSVLGMSERPSYAGSSGPALVLDVELENLVPLALVKENKVPVQYKILNLADHLYLLVDGRRAARLNPDASEWPGHLPMKGLTLDRQGARLRGNVVFEPGPSTSLELRFYDFSHGHVKIPLKGAAPEEKALIGPARNEAIEIAVYGVKREPGRLSVDLRGRSLIEIDSDATAFDPKAAPGTRFKMGTVADWKDARRHLQLVVDGEYAVASEDYPEAPRYLPDVFTGAVATFALPEKAASLELRCDFPNAGFPDGRVIRPKAVTLLLEGKVPETKAVEAIAKIDDDIFQVEIAGQALDKGRLTLDVVVRNTGGSLEMFQTDKQIKYLTEKGALLALDPSTFKGPKAPLVLLGVPPGGRRVFQAVFQIPETEKRPRLAYAGVSKAVNVNLKPLGAPAPAPTACPACKAEIGPADKFCAGCGAKLK